MVLLFEASLTPPPVHQPCQRVKSRGGKEMLARKNILTFLYLQPGERDRAGPHPQHQEAQVHLQREGGG